MVLCLHIAYPWWPLSFILAQLLAGHTNVHQDTAPYRGGDVRGLLVLPFISSFYFPSSYFPVSFPFPLVPTLLFPFHSQ